MVKSLQHGPWTSAVALIFEWSNGLRISPYSRKQDPNILHFGYALQILVVVPAHRSA